MWPRLSVVRNEFVKGMRPALREQDRQFLHCSPLRRGRAACAFGVRR